MQCGLLGEKLSHSYSPQIHSALASYSYELYEKGLDQIETFLKNGDFTGLNVTIPYKKTVIPFCSELSSCAQKMGAVNTIVRRKDGSLIGHNTDRFGFTFMVRQSGLEVTGKKVLVLGSGGASVTAVASLKEMGANVVVISRSGEDNYDNISIHSDASVIVNATPVGMYPKTGVSPVNIDLFPKLEGALDMIYNPARTKLLLDAEARNLVAENGLWMLVAQAKESAEWFTGHSIPDSKIPEIYAMLRKQMENVILIGMPGSGKSTIGKLLAQKLNKTFVDADAVVEQTIGKPIPEIFSQSGEPSFRTVETQVLQELGKRSELVIATGGGCVTRQENYPLLHQNGTIVWLQRDIRDLPTDGRPLSQKGKLDQMYQIRKPLYENFADITVDNNHDLEDTVRQLLDSIE